jgi:hypothetical protein
MNKENFFSDQQQLTNHSHSITVGAATTATQRPTAVAPHTNPKKHKMNAYPTTYTHTALHEIYV